MNFNASAGVGSAATDDALAGRRACDQCRMRKVRCDKELPTCSNCRTAKRACTTGSNVRKEPRQRVLISSQYERKIDQIESRLGNIESLLQNLSAQAFAAASNHGPATTTTLPPGTSASSSHHSASHTPQTTSGSISTTTATAAAAAAGEYNSSDEDDPDSVYGGDTGLSEQTAFASEFLERAVKRTSLKEMDPRMETARENLRQLVEMQKKRSISHGPRFPLQQPVPPGGVSKLPMPPLDTVVSLLKKGKSAAPSLFTTMCALVGIRDFISRCRAVYFPAEDFSDATFAVVNAGLYNLFFEEQELAKDPVLREEYGSYMRLCRANLETSLANLPLFLSPRIENVQALLMGALYAIDVSRPSVAWHLTSAAAGLCITGGYHRAECLADDAPSVAQTKAIAFWHIYTLDKGLGLRLGRASVIRDCDITIPRKFDFDEVDDLDAADLATMWVEVSHIQSLAYEHLYSPAAQAGPRAEVTQWAEQLATQCKKLGPRAESSRDDAMSKMRARGSSEVIDIFFKGDEIQFHVTMTLLYRVIPSPEGSPSRFCDECLFHARQAMQVHKGCMEKMNMGDYVMSIYIHWNLMLTPFAPFFVLFCYVIETVSFEDLRIIQGFVKSLQNVRHSAETIEKLYRLCQVICDVATLYVDAKSQQSEDQDMAPIGDEFQMYLSQLGMLPNQDMVMGNAPQQGPDIGGVGGPGLGMGQAQVHPGQAQGQPPAQIADWFSLLEEDLPQMQNYPWMAGPM